MGARPNHFTFTQHGPLRVFSTTELLNLPIPDWLVDDFVPQGSLVGLYGPSGSGKSFVAIDIAMQIAAGGQWLGKRQVEQGFVLYVSAEGGTGIGKRAAAWLITKGITPHDIGGSIGWITESIPVNADSEQIETLMNRIAELQVRPSLVVIDTMARCFDGDENETEDMGKFVQGVDLLRFEYGSTVMVVHHTGWNNDRERGNKAFRSAADTMIAVDKTEDLILLHCTKQKDYADFADIELRLVPVAGTDSCVVQPFAATAARQAKRDQILQILTDNGPLRYDAWRVQCASEGLERDFYKQFDSMRKQGVVTKRGDKWSVAQ